MTTFKHHGKRYLRTLLLVSIGLYERFEPGFLALDVTSLSIVASLATEESCWAFEAP